MCIFYTNSCSLAKILCVKVIILLYYCYNHYRLRFRSSNCIVCIVRNIYINNIASACLFLLNKHPVLVFLLASHMYAVRNYFYELLFCSSLFIVVAVRFLCSLRKESRVPCPGMVFYGTRTVQFRWLCRCIVPPTFGNIDNEPSADSIAWSSRVVLPH